MPAATRAGGDPCGQPDSKAVNGPGASVSRSYACSPSPVSVKRRPPTTSVRSTSARSTGPSRPRRCRRGSTRKATACAALPLPSETGTTARRLGAHHRNAWWSNSASDDVDSPRPARCSSRGAAGSETSKSETCVPSRHALRRRVLPDADQLVLADRVQVGRVAEDLQLAGHARVRRVGEVERVERIGLAEGHDVAAVADEAHGVDALAAAEAADLPGLLEPAAVGREHGDVALALAGVGRGGGRAQHALVLGERELVEQLARDLPARAVVRALVAVDVEAVDRGVAALPAAGGRDVDAALATRRRCSRRSSRRRSRGRGARSERSKVSTLSIPAPVNRGVRRTSSQATSARRRLRPLRRLRRTDDGTQPARRARSGLRCAASAIDGRPVRTGAGTGSSIARGVEVTTILTVWPCRRELTCCAVDAELRSTRIAAGLAMSTSVSSVPPPLEEITSDAPALRQHLGARAADRHRAQRARRRAARVDGGQPALRQREDVGAVGLDDVRLVDAGLLDVGGRRVVAAAAVSGAGAATASLAGASVLPPPVIGTPGGGAAARPAGAAGRGGARS